MEPRYKVGDNVQFRFSPPSALIGNSEWNMPPTIVLRGTVQDMKMDKEQATYLVNFQHPAEFDYSAFYMINYQYIREEFLLEG